MFLGLREPRGGPVGERGVCERLLKCESRHVSARAVWGERGVGAGQNGVGQALRVGCWMWWVLLLEALLGSILGLVGVWEADRPQGRGLEELGLAQGRLGTRKWSQHGPNLSQVGANLGPTWAQLEPTWSQLGSMLGPDRLK